MQNTNTYSTSLLGSSGERFGSDHLEIYKKVITSQSLYLLRMTVKFTFTILADETNCYAPTQNASKPGEYNNVMPNIKTNYQTEEENTEELGIIKTF